MFEYIRNRFTFIKQSIQSSISPLIRQPIVMATTAIHTLKPKAKAAVVEVANETILELQPQLNHAARSAATAAVDEVFARVKGAINPSTPAATTGMENTPPTSNSNDSALIHLITNIGLLLTKMLTNFINKLFGPLINVFNLLSVLNSNNRINSAEQNTNTMPPTGERSAATTPTVPSESAVRHPVMHLSSTTSSATASRAIERDAERVSGMAARLRA